MLEILLMHRPLRMALKAIVKGGHGGYFTVADIGRDELTQEMGVSAKRIPPWLLPDSCLARAGIDPADRHRVRPDILLVEMTSSESTYYTRSTGGLQELQADMGRQDVPSSVRSAGRPKPQCRKVWLIEGGYTSDTRYLEKIAQKKAQHQRLMEALKLKRFDAQLMIFAFGVGGSIYKQTMKDLRQLGVSAAACTKIL